jgi:hypothetical protein
MTTATIVQSVTGATTTNYGIGTTAITTQFGNAIVAFIGWNCVTPGNYVPTPAVSVSDSAGNLWRQVGISAGGTSVASTRSAVWMTVGASSVDWVSVGVAGYTSAAAWTITEISGLAQMIQMDYSVGTSGTTATASLTGIASGADIGFIVMGVGNAAETLSSGPSGWTALTSSSSGSGTTGTVVFPYWNPGVTAGTATPGFTLGTAAPYSYVLSCIAVSASPPAQYTLNFPLVQIETAFGTQPGAYSSSTDFTYSSEYVSWTDISTRVIGPAAEGRVSCARGRQYELQQEEAGTMTVFLNNYDGAFTPSNPGSPFYSNALNANMSFQSGVPPWITHATSGTANITLSQSSTYAFASAFGASATYCLEVAVAAVSTTAPGTESEFVAVNPNYPYTASAWFYTESLNVTVQMTVNWYNSSQGLISGSTGSSTLLTLGVWTQCTVTVASIPSGAVYARIIPQAVGVYAGGITFYVAEAALATGSSVVSTGLVALETPVRLSCWWQGVKFPLWMGYVERWPQMWPDMPQYGFSQITATDALSICSAGAMNSALASDVLVDNPYAYLPCNEQYTSATVGATPSDPTFFAGQPNLAPADANGLIALNRANSNQVTGTYADGNNQQCSTGLAMNFFGDDGTGMGATGYSGVVRGQRGPSMIYSDPGMASITNSANGWTMEFWVNWSGSANTFVSFLTGYGIPSAFWTPTTLNNSGACINVGLNPLFAGGLSVVVDNTSIGPAPFSPSSSPQQIVIVFNSINYSLYINGQYMQTSVPTTTQHNLSALVLGPGRYSYDCNNEGSLYEGQNFAAGHLAVYSYPLSPSRIFAHYQTGSTGWSGPTAAYRFAQILTWAQLGLKRGGYYAGNATGNPEITSMGPAYQLSGSSASDAINNTAQSEGGQYFVKADGTITYLERVIGYNQTSVLTLGDNATSNSVPLNGNPGFNEQPVPSILPWTVAGSGGVSYSSAQTYSGFGSGLLSPSGGGSAFLLSSTGGITANAEYLGGAWVYSPSGWGSVQINFNWLLNGVKIGSGTPNYYSVAAASWTFIATEQFAIVGGTNQVQLSVGEAGTPGTANTLYVAYGAVWNKSEEIPYAKETEFDYDNTYLYNEVTATQQAGPNQLVEYDYRSIASQSQYFRRSALSFQSNVVSPYDVSDITTWSATQFSQPSLHVAVVKVDLASNPVMAFTSILGVDIGDIVKVNRRPIGGAVISELGIVERISIDVGAQSFVMSLQISPYTPGNEVLCVDTAGQNFPVNSILAW